MVKKTTILLVLVILLLLSNVALLVFYPKEKTVEVIKIVPGPTKYINNTVEVEKVVYKNVCKPTVINNTVVREVYSSTVQPCSLTHNCTIVKDDGQIRTQTGFRSDGQIRTQTGYR